jgi:hypothetical protein
MKTWDETLAAAAPWIEFLQRESLFDAPYSGSIEVPIMPDPDKATGIPQGILSGDFW